MRLFLEQDARELLVHLTGLKGPPPSWRLSADRDLIVETSAAIASSMSLFAREEAAGLAITFAAGDRRCLLAMPGQSGGQMCPVSAPAPGNVKFLPVRQAFAVESSASFCARPSRVFGLKIITLPPRSAGRADFPARGSRTVPCANPRPVAAFAVGISAPGKLPTTGPGVVLEHVAPTAISTVGFNAFQCRGFNFCSSYCVREAHERS